MAEAVSTTMPSLLGTGVGTDLSRTSPPAVTAPDGVSMDLLEHLANHLPHRSLTAHPTGVLPALRPVPPPPSPLGNLKVHTRAVGLLHASLLLLGPQTPRRPGQKVLSSARVVLPKVVTALNGRAADSAACAGARWVLQPPSERTVTGDGLRLSHGTQRHVCPIDQALQKRPMLIGAIFDTVANNSTPPTPQMNRRKLELLPRSTSASAAPSPLASPNPSATTSRSNPFGAAR